MTSLHDKPFILSQDTFLASQIFNLDQIPVKITIQLHKLPDQTSNEYFVSLSHFIQTPSRKPAPPVNQLNQTLVSESDNDKAFTTIRKSFLAAYEEANEERHLMPDNSWLIPNSEFVEFNKKKVQ
jgi:hypothetical protein